jgi:hypothetical protein
MDRVEDGTTDGEARQRRRVRSSAKLHPAVRSRLEHMLSGRGGRLTFANIVLAGLETSYQVRDGADMDSRPARLTLFYTLLEEKAATADEATRSEIESGIAELRKAVASYGRALGERARSPNDTTRTNPAHFLAIEQALKHLASAIER